MYAMDDATGTLPRNVLCEPHVGHSTRVATFCDEICKSLGISTIARLMLNRAALYHHSQADASNVPRALANDLGLELPHSTDGTWRAILAQYHGRRESSDPLICRLAAILDMANLFDEELEASPYGDLALAELLDERVSVCEPREPIPFVLQHLRRFSKSELLGFTKRLPVFPVVAKHLIRDGRDGKLSFERLLELASADQSLAGALIRTVHTTEFATSEPIQDLRRAILHLGTDRASSVLLTAAMRPLLTDTRTDDLWNHSLVSATLSETIAEATNICPSGDAYLLGLVHDVGRLLLRLVPPDVKRASGQLMRKGVPSSIAEVLVCGMAHSEAGAEVLRHWGLRKECADALQFHHEPEQSDSNLSAMLYLVEYLTGSEEDISSIVRLRTSLQRLHLTEGDLDRLLSTASAKVRRFSAV